MVAACRDWSSVIAFDDNPARRTSGLLSTPRSGRVRRPTFAVVTWLRVATAGGHGTTEMALDHYVARTYLKRWCDRIKNERMQAYRKSDLKQFACWPADVCTESD